CYYYDNFTSDLYTISLHDALPIYLIKKNKPNFDFFNYAGLHRPVKIYTTPQIFIEDIEIVPEVKNDVADINYNISIKGSVDNILVKLIDAAGEVVAETSGANGSIKIEQPHLWQPLNAYLYHLEVMLIDNNQVVDSYAERFGVRSVEVK